ncbi:lysine exporter protein [Methylocaldum marinum]|uniref:Lysine exporter protein n=1 Tax=Methylocaldum marinum TaxID=1432792 RepID=A0A250KRY5_9GAMM|nr:LysE family translocator [Methylocaldum marinum]BBA34367.1 lysine exporter protein [Methylocaldum marinum]
MTFTNMATLFGAMAVLAAVPSVSVLAVSARSATHGFAHGACTAMGIVVGDLWFNLLAMLGLALLVEMTDGLFILIKYLGGTYLIWLGISLWRSRTKVSDFNDATRSSLLSSFMAGLLITLGDQKAVFFYLGFLPAFVDLSALSYSDAGLVMAITVVAVGGVKLGYAYAAHRAGTRITIRGGKTMSIAAAGVMIAAGIFLVAMA